MKELGPRPVSRKKESWEQPSGASDAKGGIVFEDRFPKTASG